MNFNLCHACGQHFWMTETQCPHCKAPSQSKWIKGSTNAAMMLMLGLGALACDNDKTEDTALQPAPSPEPDYGVPDTGGIPDTAYAPLYGVPDTGDTGTPSDEPDLVNGEAVFNTVCQSCHGTNGLDIIAQAAGLNDADLESVITQGSGYMPPQSDLSPNDIIDVIAYIRSQ